MSDATKCIDVYCTDRDYKFLWSRYIGSSRSLLPGTSTVVFQLLFALQGSRNKLLIRCEHGQGDYTHVDGIAEQKGLEECGKC